MPSPALLTAIERHRGRLWGLCYRMTGSRADADDLSQEAIARAIEHEGRLAHQDRLDGWLVRLTTTTCLDYLRRKKTERRASELADPVDTPQLSTADVRANNPEAAVILRDDVRFAVIVALQRLLPRQRAALILHDVLDRPLAEVARAVGATPNAAKALLMRARAALARARVRTDVDAVVDRSVVDRMVHAIQARSVEALTALFDTEVWGVTDGGGIVQAATKPVFGARAVSRQWTNANRRLAGPIACYVRVLNGEPAIVVTAPAADNAIVAAIYVETRAGSIAALRVIRDPRKLRYVTSADS